MFSFRSFVLLLFASLWLGENVSAQTFPVQSQQVPIQQQPMQTPLFGTQGAQSVYQSHTQSQSIAQPSAPQMHPAPQIHMEQQPIRVASSNSGQSVPLYDPGGTHRAPQSVQPAAQGIQQQEIPQGMMHMGRAEPANKIIPFFLTPQEQRELDEFLVRWERYSASINRYDVNFNLLMFDATIPGTQPNQPHRTAFGYFKYNSNPRRLVYAVEGEWQGGRQIKRDDRNPSIFAEKVIIDERSVHQYDYNSQTVRQINVPPEMIGKGIADSPLPLIFAAKADDLKRRFSMKIVNIPGREDIIWLHARPLLIEDQQEFRELEILIDRRNLTAQGLKQWDINGKAYKVFDMRQPPVINDTANPVLEHLRRWFTPDVPRGWKREEMDWLASPSPSQPSVPAMHQPQMGNQTQQSSEVPLYRVQ